MLLTDMHWIERYHLQAPAVFMLESLKPLRGTMFTTIQFFKPLSDTVGLNASKLEQILQTAEDYETLIQKLEGDS